MIHLLKKLIDETALRHSLTGGILLCFTMFCCYMVVIALHAIIGNLTEMIQWYEEDWDEQYEFHQQQRKRAKESEVDQTRENGEDSIEVNSCPVITLCFHRLALCYKCFSCCIPKNYLFDGSSSQCCSSMSTCDYCCSGISRRAWLLGECLFFFIYYSTHRIPYLCLIFLYRCISWIFQVYLVRAILALIVEALYDLWLVVMSTVLALINALRSAFVVLIKWTGYLYRLTIKCFTCETQPSVAGETTPLLRSEPKNCEDQMPRYFLHWWSSLVKILLECYSGESSDEDFSDVENLLNLDLEVSLFINFNAW